jgi:O-antigen/teichoic acid export membrane protein
MDALMGAGATKATLWLNLGWAAVLFPALWVATKIGGIHGAAIAQTGVGFLVAVPLAAFALRKSNVSLRPVAAGIARPVLSAIAAGLVAFVAMRYAGGPWAFTQLVVGGIVGLAVYVPLAIPRDQLKLWVGLALRRKPAAAVALD